MKLIENLLQRFKPSFEEGGRFERFRPIYRAADAFFFSHIEETQHGPHGRDPIDIKRYMSLVIVALIPAFMASLYLFGPRVLLLLLVSYAAGGLVEVLFAMVRKEEINEGFLVTGFIFPLVLPPGIPLWLAAVGVIFGVLVGKEVFGGTGRNLFNAALVGRCFLVFAYPLPMTGTWLEPGTEKWFQLPGSLAAMPADAVTAATPLAMAARGVMTAPRDLFMGNVAGSVGETSALALLIGGIFLVLVGVASWRTITGGMAALIIAAWTLHVAIPEQVAPPLFQLLSGGWMLGIMFMATDPVTSPVTLSGKWMYGFLIGILTVLIRSFSGFVEGVMFAILFGNICAPLIDEAIIRIHARRYARERACP